MKPQEKSQFKVQTLLLAIALLVASPAARSASGCELPSKLSKLRLELKNLEFGERQNQILLDFDDHLESLFGKNSLPRSISKDEACAVVEILRLTLPADPGRTLIQSKARALVHNKVLIKSEIAKLSKADAQELNTSILIALDQEGLRW